MTEIIIKGGNNAAKLQGQGLDMNQVRRVTLAIVNTIEKSFKKNGHTKETVLKIPESEIRHRFDICWEYVLRFVGDYRWTIREIEVRLPLALNCALAGLTYEPSPRLWQGRLGS